MFISAKQSFNFEKVEKKDNIMVLKHNLTKEVVEKEIDRKFIIDHEAVSPYFSCNKNITNK